MPRSGRIDIPDILQHVIVCGIEKCDIFLGDDDRIDFVRRFSDHPPPPKNAGSYPFFRLLAIALK